MHFRSSTIICLILLPAWLTSPGAAQPKKQQPASRPALATSLATDQLVAWCIVPFDAKKRTPAQRAEMLKELGMSRCAYDWRAEHVPTFESEILEYKKHGIEFFAFWGEHASAFELFEKHDIHPQIWRMMPNPPGDNDAEKAAAAAAQLKPLAEKTKELGCQLGLYNHGGWNGQPESMVAVCKLLRAMGHGHVGIVYNFHHGHEHIEQWPKLWGLMQPYVLCLNINGMNRQAQPKILGLGQGRHELEMLQTVQRSGYSGPIGILDHRSELDAKRSLQENIQGLRWLRAELQAPGSGGVKPTPPALPRGADAAPRFKHALVAEGNAEYRSPPLTISCRVRLASKTNYNILVANETKQSPSHWELFTVRGSGKLSFYIPGSTPDHVHTNIDICDNKPRLLKCLYEADRVRIWIDNKLAADERVQRTRPGGSQGGVAIGRLVEGGLGCHGHLDWVRIQLEADDSALSLENSPQDAVQNQAESTWVFPQAPPPPDSDSAAAGGAKIGVYNPRRVKQLVAAAETHGDAIRGAQVFATPKYACISCHQVMGQGGVVGPKLAELVEKRKATELVESILWPRRTVAKEYVLWQLLTVDGERRKGYRVRSEPGFVALRDPATGSVSRWPEEEIERQVQAGTLMPDGLAHAMTEQQLLDVIKFVHALPRMPADDAERIAAALKRAQHHHPVSFEYSREPLDPAAWPSASHPVNRDRIYDFYTKQAEHFRQQPVRPMVLAAHPGLDGGQQGHWGNQNEQTWADGRWNDTVLGSVQAGVFRGQGKTVARGVCVQVGVDAEGRRISICFDPDTLSYAAVWHGRFVEFSSVRHGFMHGLKMAGTPLAWEDNAPKLASDAGAEYHGFYRHGPRVVFAYSIGGREYLDSPMIVDGQFRRVRELRDESPMRGWLSGGVLQWPQQLRKPVRRSKDVSRPYVVDTFELPEDNPWNALLFCGGHDFLSNGEAIIATMHGDVWRVSDEGASAVWRRVASGLHHLQGVVVHDDQIYVQGRDQITRLHDVDGDGEMDYYECFSKAFETSAAGHDFICGLERDDQGRFYTASGNQGLVRIAADGASAEVLATGFRNPDGLGLTKDGLVTIPCSEGSWTPASQICAFYPRKSGDSTPYFGFGGPRGARPRLPMVYLPRGLDNSSGGQVEVNSTKWGPLTNQLLHFSFGRGRQFLLLRDEVEGQLQGAAMPLAGEFLSGAHRGRFHPLDGQLYVTGMAGWGSYTPSDGCFQRVRYTGVQRAFPIAHRIHRNGVWIKFSDSIDAEAGRVGSHFAQCWNYRYSGAYGSPEYSPSHPGTMGHDPLTITKAVVGPDRRWLFLEIPDVQPCSQLHLRLHPTVEHGIDLFATVHAMHPDFQDYAGYYARDKIVAAHPLDQDLAMAAERKPNPWREPLEGSRSIRIETGKNLTFVQRTIAARAGERLELVLVNPDVVPHNWALLKPGCLVEVGQLANQLIADPGAYAAQYMPDSDKILAHTDVVGPGEEFRIYFQAPKQPGRYPYLCTFPGHWMVMNGEMIVE